MDVMRSLRLFSAKERLNYNVTQDWLLRRRLKHEVRPWSWAERNEAFIRVRKTFALALELLREREFPEHHYLFQRALVSACLDVFIECLARDECFIGFAHAMELLEVVSEYDEDNERHRHKLGETPHEEFIAGHAGVLTFLAEACAFLIAARDVSSTEAEERFLIALSRRLRRYRYNDVEPLLGKALR